MQDALPRAATIRAAIRLLADDDPWIVDVCRRRLLAWGARARPELERAAMSDADARVRALARGVLRSTAITKWTGRFTGLAKAAREGGEGVDLLADGMRAIAELLGGVDSTPDEVIPRLDALAHRLRPHVASRTSTTAARRLGAFVADVALMRGAGNLAPRRHHVRPDRALRSGKATSSLLTAMTLVLGRRAGLELTAVRLPDFFLIRVHGRRRVLVDPYHDGRTVTKSDCLRYLRARVVGSPSAYLVDIDDASVLLGVVEDVIRAYDRPCDAELRAALRRAASALGRMTRPQLS